MSTLSDLIAVVQAIESRQPQPPIVVLHFQPSEADLLEAAAMFCGMFPDVYSDESPELEDGAFFDAEDLEPDDSDDFLRPCFAGHESQPDWDDDLDADAERLARTDFSLLF